MLKIREIRERENLTQEKLASMIGVSRENVSRYESGSRIPPSDKLIKIASALNVMIDDLVVKDDTQ